MPTEREKMVSGALYRANDPELIALRIKAQAFSRAYAATTEADGADRTRLLCGALGTVGEDCVVCAPFHVDYGFNVRLGDGVFLNFGCVLLDVCVVTIGARTQIGPGVQLYAADHPRDAETRASGLENGRPVAIGADVWIGGHAIVLPGVTVGDGAVIGAGSVVTRDVAPGETVAGNPAKSLR